MTNKAYKPVSMKNQHNQSTELRKQAEEIFRENIAPLSPEETQRILYELQVHQIELELQNGELHRTQDELDNSLARYYDFYNSSPLGYLTTSGNGKILDANLTVASMLGVPRKILIKQSFTRFILKEDQDIYYLYRKQLVETCESLTCELRVAKQDGAEFWVQLDTSILKHVSGVIEYRIVISNITDRKEAERQLQVMNNELKKMVQERTQALQASHKQYLHAEKLAAIGRLSASIAHEFNNPLQGIISVLKGLKKRAILEEEDKELLEAIIGESDRMKSLIHSLQDFNRPSSGRKTLMDVHNALESILILQKSDSNGRRISVVRNFAERLPEILAVSDQIKQVFLNLLANAADACHKSGGEITINTWQNKDQVGVAIKDTGVGIKSENLEQIFRPFYTTKAEVSGTGLGLSVSYGIIKKHHGEIRVESQPGEGATFTVLLPIKGTEETASATDR